MNRANIKAKGKGEKVKKLAHRILFAITTFALCLLTFALRSQCPPGNSCYSAPLVCGNNLDGLALSTGGPNELSQPAAFCGVIENNQWIAFVACQPTVILGLNVISCQGTFTGSGLQAQIFQSPDCQAFTPVSNCFNPGSATSGTLTASGLTPGSIYYLMVDGWAGDICSYTIDVQAGIDTQPPSPQVSQPGSISGPTTVCPGQSASFTANLPVCSNVSGSGCPLPSLPPGNFTFSWNLPPGATITDNPDSPTVNVLFGNNGGQVSVTATSQNSGACGCSWACPTTIPPAQITVQNAPTSINQLPPVTICEGQSYTFCGIEYTASASPICLTNGCQEADQQQIIVLPNSTTSLGVQTICGSNCFIYAGQSFCNPGFFEIQTQNGSTCETVNFSLEQVWVDGYWSPTNVIHPTQPTAVLNGNGSSNGATNGQVTFSWSGPGGFMSTQNTPTVSAGGTYTVTVTDIETGCTFTFSTVVSEQPHDCNLPASPGDFCEFSPTFCGSELDGFCSFTENFSGEYPGNIGSIFCESIHNSAWVKFIPCESAVKIELTPSECDDQNGIEAAILATDDCLNFTMKSNCMVGLAVDTLAATGLLPGKPYFLMVDGRFGDRCKWTVKVIDGIRVEPIDVQQITPPKITGQTQACPGQTTAHTLQPPDCQVVDAGNCPLDALLDSLVIRWFVPPGGQILGDSTGLNCSVKWNSGSGGDVFCIVKTKLTSAETFCVALNGCSDFAKQHVDVKFTTTTLPPIEICNGQSTVVCGNLISTTQNVICQTACGETIQPVVVKNPVREDFGDIAICPGQPYVFAGHDYETPGFYQILAQNGACIDTFQFTISEKMEPPLALSAVAEECDAIGATYRIKFDFASGMPPFFINGAAVAGPSWQSNPVTNQFPYLLTITDSRVCGDSTIILMGQKDCACVSFAGQMSLDTLATCPPNSLIANHLGGELLDADDFTEFVLHTAAGDSLGQILGINQSGEFQFLADSMSPGTLYFVSLVVGNSIDGGYVDLTDRCLSISPGQPVVFWPPPEALAGPDFSIDCQISGYPLSGAAIPGSPQGVDYQWIRTGGTSFSSTEKMPFVNQPGFYKLVVTDLQTGCTGSDEVQVFQQIIEPGIVAADVQITCPQPVASLAASSPTANSTFFWLAPNGDTLVGSQILASQPGIFQAFAVGPNGCFSMKNVNVADGRLPIPHSTADGEINCQLGDFQLVTTVGLPNCAFAWSGPAGFSSLEQSPTASQPGLYFLEITEPTAGCTARDTVEILDNRQPIPTTATGGQIDCQTPEIQLVTTVGLPNCTFEWSGPAGFSSSLQSPMASLTGLYFLKTTGNVAGCFGADTVEVLDGRLPIPTMATGGQIDCQTPEIQLVTNVGLPNCTFFWSGPAGFSSSLQSPFASQPGLYFLKTTGEVAGCFGADTVEVLDGRLPILTTATGGTIDCQTVEIQLVTTAGLPDCSFEWSGPGGFSSTEQSPSASQPGLYFLKTTGAVSGCFGGDTVEIFDSRIYPAVVIKTPEVLTCSVVAALLDGSGSAAGPTMIYEWNSPTGGQILGQNQATAMTEQPGIFTLKITDVSNGCTGLATVEVIENTNLPTALFLEKTNPSCAGFADGSIEILGATGGELPLEFAFDGGPFSDEMVFENLPAGEFELAVRDKNGCLFFQKTTLYEPPAVIVNLGPDLEIGLGETVNLTATASWAWQNLPTVEWKSWPDGFGQTGGAHLEAAPLTTTIFAISVKNEANCADSDSIQVRVRKKVPVFVANIFSPNGDGENELAEIQAGPGVSKILHFEIFDRWGERVFEAADFEPGDSRGGWDGSFRGQRAAVAVYFWWAEVELVDGRREILKGDLSISR